MNINEFTYNYYDRIICEIVLNLSRDEVFYE